MNLLRRLTRLVNPQSTTSDNSTQLEMFYTLLEQAERYHHAEEYERALQVLAEAERIAGGLQSAEKFLVVSLSRAGIFAKQQRLDEAERLLSRMQAEAEQQNDSLKMAYVLISKGVLAQESGDLDGAEAAFDAALRAARDAQSTGAEGRAQAHLADVSLYTGNASFAVYLLREALPKLNMSGDVQLNSYFVGRLGEALIGVGDVNEGQQLLGRALRLAEHMGYRAYEHQWRNALAIQAVIIGNYADAKRHLMAVLATSKSNSTDNVILLCRLSHITLRLGEYDIAHDYARQAADIATKMADNKDLHLRTQAALGIVLRMMDKPDVALPYLKIASMGYESLAITPADHSYVDLLRNLAAAQTIGTDFEKALETYNTALRFANANDDRLDVAGIYRDMGILYVRKAELDTAIKSWSNALDIYDSLDEAARIARLYCDIASLRKQVGQWQRAAEDYKQALMLLSSVDDDETRGIVLSNAAAAYVDQGDVQTAESFFIDAIKIAQKLNDRHSEATRRGNYGWFLLSTGRADRAMASLTYALRQSENLGMDLQAAVQTDNMGLAQVELGDFEKAYDLQTRALKMIEAVGNPVWEATIKVNLGHTLLRLNRYAEAKGHFVDGLDIGQSHNRQEVVIRAKIGLAYCVLHEDDSTTVEQLTQSAIDLAERMNMRRLLADALSVRSQYMMQVHHDKETATADWKRARKLYNMLHLPLDIRTPLWVQEHGETIY